MEKALSNHYAARFDQYLFPFYMKDINEGRLTRQEAAELMGNIFIFWDSLEPFLFGGLVGKRDHQAVAQANYIVNVTLGGIDRSFRAWYCMLQGRSKPISRIFPFAITTPWHLSFWMLPSSATSTTEQVFQHGSMTTTTSSG